VKFVPPAGRVVPGRGGAAGVAGARRFLFPERVHNERTGRESERLARRCSPLLLRPRATCCGWGGFFFLSFLLFAVTDAPRRRPRRLLERKKATGRGRREKDEEVLAKPPPSEREREREDGPGRAPWTPSRSSAASECASPHFGPRSVRDDRAYRMPESRER